MRPIKDGDLYLFTFKEGMLSAIAHDLRLSVKRFRIKVGEDRTVEALFFPDSIEIDGVMRDGQLDTRTLSDRDKGKIRSTIAGQVLRSSQFGRIEYKGGATPNGDGTWTASGDLTLVGQTRPIQFVMRLEDGAVRGEMEIRPSDWGIKPYRALGGTLKVQDRVAVAFALPAPTELP